MAAIPIGLAPLIGDFGLGAVIVQNRKLSDNQLGSLASAAVALGGLMTVSFIVLSGPNAVYFREMAVARHSGAELDLRHRFDPGATSGAAAARS
jgi:hypothetical protein